MTLNQDSLPNNQPPRAITTDYQSSSTNSADSASQLAKLEEASDEQFTFRWLEEADYEKGYRDTLKGLTTVDDITKEQFSLRYNEMFPRLQDVHKIVVIEDTQGQKVIGTGALIIERKFTRSLAICGHIEDIVVDETYQGK